jgi:hypothetical protein
MKCPYCGHINEWSEDQCLMCRRDIAYLRDRTFLGQQFVFFEASEEQPILVRLIPVGASEGDDHRFTRPTIISRHEHGVRLERRPSRKVPEPEQEDLPQLSFPWSYRHFDEPFELPVLNFPRLHLVAVATDRRVYRPGDEVHLFVAAPGAAGQEAELGIELAGQSTHQARIRLNQAGLGLTQFGDLEPGVYTIQMTLPDRPAIQASCSFTCAEFTLSPLSVSVESHTLEGYQLSVELKLAEFGTPYDGPLELVVRNAGHVVYEGKAEARAGQMEADLGLEPLTWGDITIEVSTPQGNTASVVCRRISWEDWDRVTLSPLGPHIEAALVPVHGVEGEIRGLHYVHGRQEHTPFALESIVGTEGRIAARRNAELVHLLIFDPLRGDHRKLEFQDVKAGDVLRFRVGYPYALFTLGAFMGRALPYEAWGVVVWPVGLKASLEAPAEAGPEASISVRVETDGPASCLLLVYDPRLEHEDPLTRLARCIFEQIFDSTWRLEARHVSHVAWLMSGGLQTVEWRFSLQGKGQPMRTALRMSYEEALKRAAPRAFLMASGETIPELAHIDLFPVDGPVEVPIQLGDQAVTCRCRAYFFRDYDYVSVTRDIQVGE